MKQKYLFAALLSLASIPQIVNAKRIVIEADTKVFETPIAKDEYAAVNDNDDPVILLKGMAFPVQEEKAGWYIIEYSPGLRGMVMTNVVADSKTVATPTVGTYTVTNNPKEKVTVAKDSNGFTLATSESNYKGDLEDNVILFKSGDGATAYSLTVQNGKPALFTYSNAITKFF